MKIVILPLGFLLILMLACAKTESENIKTSGIYATYNVTSTTANTSLTSCNATFNVEKGGTYIDLSDSDTVTCNGQSMSKSVVGNYVSYSANVTATVGGTYSIVLTRSGESPYTATVTLPNFVTGATVASSQNKGVQLNFSWTASSDAADGMEVSMASTNSSQTTCPDYAVVDDSAPEGGTGAFSSIQTTVSSGGTSGSCSASIKWRRYCSGSMPSGLGGDIKAYQTHEAAITLN